MDAGTTNPSEFDNPYPKDQVVATLRCLVAGYKKLSGKIAEKQMMEQMKHHHDPWAKDQPIDVRDVLNRGPNDLKGTDLDFRADLDEIEQTAFSQNSIDDPAKFQKSCDITYKDDLIVSHLVKRRSVNVEFILKGWLPIVGEAELPTEMTQEHTLSVMCKVQSFMMTNVLNMAQELLNRGEIVSGQNPEYKLAYEKLKLDQLRAKIFKELGMDQFLDCPEEVLQKAVQTFTYSGSNDFKNKKEVLEAKTKHILMAVMNGHLDLNNIQEYKDQALQMANLYSDEDAPLKSAAQNTGGDSEQPSTQNQEL